MRDRKRRNATMYSGCTVSDSTSITPPPFTILEKSAVRVMSRSGAGSKKKLAAHASVFPVANVIITAVFGEAVIAVAVPVGILKRHAAGNPG